MSLKAAVEAILQDACERVADVVRHQRPYDECDKWIMLLGNLKDLYPDIVEPFMRDRMWVVDAIRGRGGRLRAKLDDKGNG